MAYPLLPDRLWPVRVAACLALVVGLTSLFGCQSTPRLEHRLPAVVIGGWSRSHIEPMPKDAWQVQAAEAVRVDYAGPGKISVDIYRMHSQSSAFEAVQRWRAAPAHSVTWKNDLFLVFSYDDPARLRSFSKAFIAGIR